MIIIVAGQSNFVVIEVSPPTDTSLLVEVASKTSDTLAGKDAEDFALMWSEFYDRRQSTIAVNSV
jgi:hypothetical protein